MSLNQKGQAVIMAFVILPLLFIGLMYFQDLFSLLNTKMRVQKQCRIQTLKAQKEIIKGFESLMQLNPEAKRLRASARSARRAVAAAADPYSKAAAVAYLATVTAQQVALGLKQQSIITKSKSKAKVEIYRIEGQTYTGLPPFVLKRTPFTSLSPSYIKPRLLSKKQEILVGWKVKSNFKLSMEGICGSHVKSTPTGFQAKYSYPDTF